MTKSFVSRNDLTRGDGAGLRVSNDPSRMNDSGARTQAPIPAASNENHAHGEAGRASQSGPSENHIGLNSSRLNPAGRSDHLTERTDR